MPSVGLNATWRRDPDYGHITDQPKNLNDFRTHEPHRLFKHFEPPLVQTYSAVRKLVDTGIDIANCIARRATIVRNSVSACLDPAIQCGEATENVDAWLNLRD